MRQRSFGGDVRGVGHNDFAAIATTAALAADADRGEQPARPGQAAIAAAAAYGLRQDADRQVAIGLDRAGVLDRHLHSLAAIRGRAADRQRRSADRDGEAARTAAAADRLRLDAVRLDAVRGDVGSICHVDGVAVAAAGALAGDADIEPEAARDGAATGAAAAADRLSENTRRAVLHRVDGAVVYGDGDGVGAARGPCLAADTDGSSGRKIEREAAIAATAADRLHDQAGRIRLMGGDRGARGVVFHGAGSAAALAIAADADGEAEADADDTAAIAAAAADRLHDDAGRTLAPCLDRAVIGRVHGHAGPGRAGTAADAQVRHRGEGADEAAIATAAADRLHDQAGRIRAVGRDGLCPPLWRTEEDLAAIAALGSRAADADRGAEAAGDDEAAIAATAAERLRDDAGRAVLECLDAAAGGHVDLLAGAAGAALAADPDGDHARSAQRKAAIAATAADRLRQDAGGIRAVRRNLRVGDVVGHHVAVAAGRAAAANGDRGDGAGRETAAAIAAAAADRLRQDADRRIAVGADDGAVSGLVDVHRPAIAARTATAADGNRYVGARRKRETAIAAAAADRLRKHAMGAVRPLIDAGADRSADIGVDGATLAATAGGAADGHDADRAAAIAAAAADRFDEHADRADAAGLDVAGIRAGGGRPVIAVRARAATAPDAERVAAVATATADRLHHHAAGIVAGRRYVAGIASRGAAADGRLAAISALPRKNAIAAGAVTRDAAGGAHEHSLGERALGADVAGVGRLGDPAIAAGAAIATLAATNGADLGAAIAAAAAARLGGDAVTVIEGGYHACAKRVRHLDVAAIAAGAAGTATGQAEIRSPARVAAPATIGLSDDAEAGQRRIVGYIDDAAIGAPAAIAALELGRKGLEHRAAVTAPAAIGRAAILAAAGNVVGVDHRPGRRIARIAIGIAKGTRAIVTLGAVMIDHDLRESWTVSCVDKPRQRRRAEKHANARRDHRRAAGAPVARLPRIRCCVLPLFMRPLGALALSATENSGSQRLL